MGTVQLLCNGSETMIPIGNVKLVRHVDVNGTDKIEVLEIKKTFYHKYCEIIGAVTKLGIDRYEITKGSLLIGGQKQTDWASLPSKVDFIQYMVEGATEAEAPVEHEAKENVSQPEANESETIHVMQLAKNVIGSIKQVFHSFMQGKDAEAEPEDAKSPEPPISPGLNTIEKKEPKIQIPDNIKVFGGDDSLAMKYAILREQLKAASDVPAMVKIITSMDKTTKRSRSSADTVAFRDASVLSVVQDSMNPE